MDQLFSFEGLPSFKQSYEPIIVVFKVWVAPVAGIVLTAGIVSFIFSWLSVAAPKAYRKKSLNKETNVEGVKINMGVLPIPKWKVKVPKYRAEDINLFLQAKLATYGEKELKFEDRHKKLFLDILIYIWSKRNESFVGAGHQGDLYEHTLGALDKSWKGWKDPLVPIAVAGHDAGKIFAFNPKIPNADRHNPAHWDRVGYHDDYSMMFVTSLDSFQFLTTLEKETLRIALGYSHKQKFMPVLKPEVEARVKYLLKQFTVADKEQTAQEKSQLLLEKVTEQNLTDAFLTALKRSVFQNKNLARGQQSTCFKKDGIVYILEPGFRDLFLAQYPEDVAAAFGAGYRRVGNMSPATIYLVNFLKQKGWLLERANNMKSKCGLWVAKSGKMIFNGVIAVKLPEEVLDILPEDSTYEISLTCPLDMQPQDRIEPDNLIPVREDKSHIDEEVYKQAQRVAAGSRQPVQKVYDEMIKAKSKMVLSEKEEARVQRLAASTGQNIDKVRELVALTKRNK